MLVDQVSGDAQTFRRGDNVLGDFVPRNIEIDMAESWIREDVLKDGCVSLYRSYDTPHARVRPDDRRLGMPREQGAHLRQISGWSIRFGERDVHIIVNDYEQAHVTCEI